MTSLRRLRVTGPVIAITGMILLVLGSCATPSVLFEVPEGFARYEEDGRQGAISPEGLLLSAYRTENEPPQNLEFWTEAMELHLADAGYLLLHKGEFETADLDGRYFEWVAPLGDEDWVYLTALCVDGDAIAVVEAAGPYEVYDRYRDGIRGSLRTVRVR
jgi:hypothetical protein